MKIFQSRIPVLAMVVLASQIAFGTGLTTAAEDEAIPTSEV